MVNEHEYMSHLAEEDIVVINTDHHVSFLAKVLTLSQDGMLLVIEALQDHRREIYHRLKRFLPGAWGGFQDGTDSFHAIIKLDAKMTSTLLAETEVKEA